MVKKIPFQLENKKSILYIAQPSEIKGTLENFVTFVDVLSELDFSIKVFFKPHPNEQNKIEFYEKILSKLPHEFEILTSKVEIENYIYFADLVVTCFSTSGIDHNFLQYYSDKELGDLVYLNAGKDILKSMERVIGVPYVPGTDVGLGHVCSSNYDFNRFLIKNLNGIRSNYKQTVKDRISMVDGPTASIYSSIESLIKTI